MQAPSLEALFKSRERYQSIIIDSDFFCIRLDGFKFSRLSEELFGGSFSDAFHESLKEAVIELIRRGIFNILLAFVGSDEVNLFIKGRPFRGRIEKLVSVSSGLLSSLFSANLSAKVGKRVIASFDARIVEIRENEVIDYLIWRQKDIFRNFLNKMAYLALLQRGMKPKEIADALRGLKAKELLRVIEESFGDIDRIPCWVKYGTLLFWTRREKRAFNPILGKEVITFKRGISEACFSFEKRREFLESIVLSAIGTGLFRPFTENRNVKNSC